MSEVLRVLSADLLVLLVRKELSDPLVRLVFKGLLVLRVLLERTVLTVPQVQ